MLKELEEINLTMKTEPQSEHTDADPDVSTSEPGLTSSDSELATQHISLEEKKREIVDHLMQEFLSGLDKWVATFTRHEDSSSSTQPSTSGGDPASSTQGTTPASTSNSDKGKRKADKRSRQGVNGDEEDDKDFGEPPVKKPRSGGQKGPLLACPYHKQNPRRYTHYPYRTCAGPGWDTICHLV